MGDPHEEIAEANFSSVVKVFLGVLLFFAALTQLWLVMRVVMAVGGFCAEGGPYLVTTPCPKGLSIFAPLSIIVLIAARGLYLSAQFSKGPKWDFLFWTILFISLGWNFMEFAFTGEGVVIGDLIPGIIFMLIGLVPFLIMRSELSRIIFGEADEPDVKTPFILSRASRVLVHFGALVLGVLGGCFSFSILT